MASLHIEQLIPALPRPLIEGLFSATASIQLSAGQTLFGSGDEPDGCYLLKRGVVKVVVSSSQANERIIAVLGPGSFIGELSILDGKPRSASIVAIKDCDLSFATRDAFKAFARKNPDIYEHLTCLLARRLRETDDLLAATSFATVKRGSHAPCSNWPSISVKKKASPSRSITGSVKLIWQPWPVLPAKMWRAH